jgi:alkane 1-monooxygenase
MRALKYLTVLSLPVVVYFALMNEGVWAWSGVLFAFGIIPVLDWLVGEKKHNLTDEEVEEVRSNKWFDFFLFITVPVQFISLFVFIQNASIETSSDWGHIASMGVLCGVIGINVAHELGHRPQRLHQFAARLLLLSSLYMHFFIEHNRGHHKHVGTPDDPSSAPKGMGLYRFWTKTIVGTWMSSWEIVAKERKRKGLRAWSLTNEMFVYQSIQVGFILSIAFFFGWEKALAFVSAAFIGILLLETVNYIEHYGLGRKKVNQFRYEEVEVWHSWNSDFMIGRLVLFELTRHSDHHFDAAKPYPILASHDEAPQLPAGYPAMMLLSLCPPLWFRVMDGRIERK